MSTEEKIRLQELAYKWLDGTLTDAEQLEFDSWFVQTNIEPLEIPSNIAENKEQYRQLIFSRIKKEIGTAKPHMVYSLWPRIAVAASIILVIGAGVFFYTNRPATETVQTDTYANDVAPGKQGATLTLANGKKIRLTDAVNGELAKEAGVVITKSVNGQLVYEIKDAERESNNINVLSTAQGETYQVRLPDGSLVWLNAASSLTYSAALNERGQRRVRLDGEGYFEIAKDKAHPFIVQTDKQEVEVLGTHFNINAYKDEGGVKTTLLEGSVKISSGQNKQILKPGYQAINSGNAIKVSEVDTENITDWKNGDFYLDRIDFKSAMRKIERWYNVEVVYDASVPDNMETGGWISRNKSLSQVLSFIESSGLVHFKIEGRKVYVSK